MAIVLNGTTGITNDSGYTGDGVSFADSTPANTLVTTSGGNVGIGTSSPGVGLAIQGATADAVTIQLKQNAAGGNDYRITSRDDGSLRFNNDTAGAERMRIDSSGNLLVGTTVSPVTGRTNGVLAGSNSFKFRSPAGNNEWGINLTSGVLAYLYSDNGTTYVYAGSISLNGNTASYNSVSDYRLKENITPMTGALEKVALLKPVTYTFKNDGQASQGFIAHELQEVIPEAVTGTKDAVKEDGSPEYQGIDTSFLVATLTAALQEQQAIITALTARVEALEGAQA